MKPQQWGPLIWYLIHSIAYSIKDDEFFIKHKKSYLKFYNSLQRIIPCPICRGHFQSMMKNKDINKCDSKESMIQWTISKHNKVNQRLKKRTINKEKADILYDKINVKKILKSIDILTFNTQRIIPLQSYKNFFESLRIIFPIESFRVVYQEGMRKNAIVVKDHRTLIQWYKNLGNYVSKNLGNYVSKNL